MLILSGQFIAVNGWGHLSNFELLDGNGMFLLKVDVVKESLSTVLLSIVFVFSPEMSYDIHIEGTSCLEHYY